MRSKLVDLLIIALLGIGTGTTNYGLTTPDLEFEMLGLFVIVLTLMLTLGLRLKKLEGEIKQCK